MRKRWGKLILILMVLSSCNLPTKPTIDWVYSKGNIKLETASEKEWLYASTGTGHIFLPSSLKESKDVGFIKILPVKDYWYQIPIINKGYFQRVEYGYAFTKDGTIYFSKMYNNFPFKEFTVPVYLMVDKKRDLAHQLVDFFKNYKVIVSGEAKVLCTSTGIFLVGNTVELKSQCWRVKQGE